MALYTKESIDGLREAVDMVALVSQRTDLRRVGSRWVGLCPFHDERTPSFSVNAELGVYKCFGCDRSGDAITFVREAEGLDFPEAVDSLADRFNVELKREEEDPRAEERRKRRERLLALVDRAARYYSTYLWDSGEAAKAREYLEGRGLSEQVLRDFRVGYSPSPWDKLVTGAQRDGFKPPELVAAGLAQPGRDGGIYDRFRGRIMFPLADARGRVLGFGARRLRETQKPKYLNTSDNEIYHKGRQLFGIDRARAAAAKAGRVVVVEGYTDVLALHQAGIEETVAIMGTAVTPDQVGELAKAAPTVVLALDADSSGQEAMLRAARGAEDRDIELQVVQMPAGADPADLVGAEGADAMRALLGRSISVPEFAVRRALAAADLDSPTGRDRALRETAGLIATTQERSALRDELVRYAADRLDVPADYVLARLTASPRPVRQHAPQAPVDGDPGPEAGPHGGGPPGVSDGMLGNERRFLAMCAGHPPLGREYLERLGDDHLSSDTMRRARAHLLEHYDDPLEGLPDDDPAVAALVTQVAALAEEEPSGETVLRMGFLQLELRRVERALRRAADKGDRNRQNELSGERQQIRREMDAVMGQTA